MKEEGIVDESWKKTEGAPQGLQHQEVTISAATAALALEAMKAVNIRGENAVQWAQAMIELQRAIGPTA